MQNITQDQVSKTGFTNCALLLHINISSVLVTQTQHHSGPFLANNSREQTSFKKEARCNILLFVLLFECIGHSSSFVLLVLRTLRAGSSNSFAAYTHDLGFLRFRPRLRHSLSSSSSSGAGFRRLVCHML